MCRPTSRITAAWALGLACLVNARATFGQASQFALRFYGTGTAQQDRVRIPIDDNAPGADASAPCDVGAGSFTVECWLRGNLADNGSGNSGGDGDYQDFRWINGNIIVDRDIFGASSRDWGISIAGGLVQFGTGRADANPLDGENTIEGNVIVLDGNWHHVACVRDAATGGKRIYIDGILDFESAANRSRDDISYPNGGDPAPVTPWGPYIVLAAEKHDAGSSYPSFNGFMDELRIWSVPRTQADLLATYNRVAAYNAPGLVGYYRFEEGSGTTINDSSATGSPDGLLIAGAAGNGEWVSYSSNSENTAPITSGPLPPGFVRSTVATGLNEPTVLEFTPDGRLLVAERDGTIRIVQGGALLPAPLIDIPVNTLNGERGLVGMTLDPNFTANGFLYSYYTNNEPRNRVGRFTVVGNSANVATEVVLWENPDLAADFHHGGAIAFGRDGHLYIATGDQFDSASAQSLSNQHGKILRLEPDGGIPPKNPFVGVPGAQEQIWALGLRNPFRFVFDFDGAVERMYIGNVGGNSFDSWEEVNRGAAGANYGWPNQEGPVCFVSDCSDYTFPIWSYQHNDPEYFVDIVQGSISLGPVYRGTVFPPEYRGNLYAGDYANRWIRRLIFDGAGNVIADPLFVQAPDAGTIVDLEVGPDGALYFVTVGTPWSGAPDVGAVYRIAYTGSTNAPPIVFAAASPTSGPAPLTVQFNSTGSDDPDEGPGPLTYNWLFGDGGSSSAPNPQHIYQDPGMFQATLTLSDGADQTTSPPITIIVGNPPTGIITLPLAGATYRAGDTISFAGTANDPEDGALPASAFRWQILLVHAAHTHPFLGPLNGVTGGSFLIVATGHSPENTFYEIRLSVTDSDGLTHTSARALTPQTATIALDTDPSGIPIFLDGEAVNTPRNYTSLIGFQHIVEAQTSYVLNSVPYLFACWSDAGTRTHNYTTPDTPSSLIAIYGGGGQTQIAVDVAADNRDADYYPDFGEELGNFYNATNLCSGREPGGDWIAAAEFALPVPQGAAIVSAVLRLTAADDNSGSPVSTVRAYDVDHAAVFDITHTHRLTDHHAQTSASTTWVWPTFTPGQAYDSPELGELVQVVVNRANWMSGNFIGLVFDGTPSPEGTWRCFRDFTSGFPARLTVTYAVPGQPSCCNLNCDNGLFCDGVETCVNGSCQAGQIPCTVGQCDESSDSCIPSNCPSPAVIAVGPRALRVTPAAGANLVASRIRGDPADSAISCVDFYLQTDGSIGTNAEFRLPSDWGQLVVRSEEVRPFSRYDIQTDCGTLGFPVLSPAVSAFTWIWGDVDNSGIAELNDILCELDGYASDFSRCGEAAVNLAGCVPDQVVEIGDLLFVLDAYSGLQYPCPEICP